MKRKTSRPKASVGSSFQISHHRVQRGDRTLQVVELVFRDVESRNSFRLQSAQELDRHLKALVKSKFKRNETSADALLFRAEGRVFCAGGNIKDHIEMGAAKSRAANRAIAAILQKLASLPIPTIAVVDGDALGGGVELLSAFDFVLSAPHAMFGFWQRRMGLTYGWGGDVRLALRMGEATVARLGLQARALTAREAHRVGIVDRICGAWSTRSEGLAEAFRLAALPRDSAAAMKKQFGKLQSTDRRDFERLWFGADHLERMAAFQRPKRDHTKS